MENFNLDQRSQRDERSQEVGGAEVPERRKIAEGKGSRGPREAKDRRRQEEGGTSGRTRQASVRPHQSIDKVQNRDFLVIG